MDEDLLRTWESTKRLLSQLRGYQPLKFLLVSIPHVPQSERRWALFQVVLSFVFMFVASGFAVLTIDASKVGRGFMITAFVLFAFAAVNVLYAVGLGIHWYRIRDSVKNDSSQSTEKLVQSIREQTDRNHQDMLRLIEASEKQLALVEERFGKSDNPKP